MLTTIPDGMRQNTSNTDKTVIHSDQEDFLIALLKMTATAVGNLAVRQPPAYTSQAQGSVERFHRTLVGQIRTLKLQLENNYDIHLTSTHPHHALVCQARSIPTQQVLCTFRRQHQLLQTAGTKNARHQSLRLVKQPSTCYQQQNTGPRWKHASFRRRFRKGHTNKQEHPWYLQTNCQSKDIQETNQARQVPHDGHHRLHTEHNTNTDEFRRTTCKAPPAAVYGRDTDTASAGTTSSERQPTLHPHRRSQTRRWQRQLHIAEEHHYRSQQQNGRWQMTLLKAVQQDSRRQLSTRRHHNDRKQHKNPTRPDSECRL